MLAPLISSAQIRAGRHLANLSQEDIAKATGLSLPTIRRVESERDVSVSQSAVDGVRAALETAGVEFIAENGGGAGVRLRKPPPPISDEAALPEFPSGGKEPYDGSPL